ncbi:MAG: 8-amino-7-oxononanoate synthase [Catillopecten margaritatus gill symbiont]|uniref:8-amino-7-oxononanoate synthase n=1 Tax=Catillopecten margaritatus gill symbiont TaxID=3083288 RepID=A0AAU6PGU3_9GAMM
MNFTSTIKTLKENHLYRSARIADDRCVDFCSNDYLGLKNHSKVVEAFKRGADKFGVGAGASHLINGHTAAHQELEEALADYTGQKKALLFSTGYMANIGVFSALKGELDWVLQDKLNHASLIDANHLIGLPLQRYLHKNIDSLEKKAGRQAGQGLIVTDSIFSMDGDCADIGEIDKVAKKSNALLMQDDAHGFGVFKADIPKHSIYMATLGKAAGVAGAFIAGDVDFIDFLVQKSRPYIYTTAIAPALCVATLESLELIKKGEQNEKLLSNIAFFQKFSQSLGLPITKSDSAIQPLVIGNNKHTLKISQTLLEQGFHVGAIRSPTVARGTERLRITLNANHTQTQIEQLLIQVKYALQ